MLTKYLSLNIKIMFKTNLAFAREINSAFALHFQPVKCMDCGNLLQSYEVLCYHQTTPVTCSACKSTFINSCNLLKHNCTIKTLPMNSPNSEKPREHENSPKANSQTGSIHQNQKQFISLAKSLHSPAQLNQSSNLKNSSVKEMTKSILLNQSGKLVHSTDEDKSNSSTNSTQLKSPIAGSSPKTVYSDSVKLIKITKLVDPKSGKFAKTAESSGQQPALNSSRDNDTENLPLIRRRSKPTKFL